MQKMTLKQFKKALEGAEMDLGVYGYEGIINVMILGLRWCENLHETEFPSEILADYDRKRIKALRETLKARGYYD